MKKFDYIILSLLILTATVTLFALTGNNKAFSNSPVEATNKIRFDVSLRGVASTQNEELFITNGETFLTIRNVPYKKLSIKKVEKKKRQIAITSYDKKNGYILIDDPGLPYQNDYIVTLEDTAKITADGAVVGGNKI